MPLSSEALSSMTLALYRSGLFLLLFLLMLLVFVMCCLFGFFGRFGGGGKEKSLEIFLEGKEKQLKIEWDEY